MPIFSENGIFLSKDNDLATREVYIDDRILLKVRSFKATIVADPSQWQKEKSSLRKYKALKKGNG